MSLPWPDLTTEEWDERLRSQAAKARRAPRHLGGAGSGNFGHAGRPGEVGGSAPEGEGDPLALAPGAPRGGEGQQALFDYAPESGSEAALRGEAEMAVTSLDALLDTAVENADYGAVGPQDWDSMSSSAQDQTFDEWRQQQYGEHWLLEAADEAGSAYMNDNITATDLGDKALDSDRFTQWLEQQGIEPESAQYDDDGDRPSLKAEDLRDTAGKPLSLEMQHKATDLFYDETDRARESLEEDIRETGRYQDAVSEAEQEALQTAWDENNDSDKFQYAKDYGHAEGEAVEKGAPDKWEFDGTNENEDYVRTRAVAKELVNMRTSEILEERGLLGHPDTGFSDPKFVSTLVASTFWSEWKRSSTSDMGIAMQMAVAEEMKTLPSAHLTEAQKLSARAALTEVFTTPKEREALVPTSTELVKRIEALPKDEQAAAWAASEKADKAGKEATEALAMGRAKAYVRGQWETTQYLLKQAGADKVDLYRAIILPKDDVEKAKGVVHATGTPLPGLKLLQNAVASTTTKPDVANEWNGVGVKLKSGETERVVLRFSAPPTAVFSVPVYGDNVHEESEVVLMGTKGLKWDAWHKEAPTFEDQLISMRRDLTATPTPEPVVVNLSTNVPGHWLIGWRKFKTLPDLTKRPKTPTPDTLPLTEAQAMLDEARRLLPKPPEE